MIVIMVALPQLNCGKVPFTMAYAISSILDLLVYAVGYNCILLFFRLKFSFFLSFCVCVFFVISHVY